MTLCFSCGKELPHIDGKPSRSEECPWCGADVRVCRNCRFYDEGAYNECREPLAERVVDKDRANFCEYFELRQSEGEKHSRDKDPLAELKKLFGEDAE